MAGKPSTDWSKRAILLFAVLIYLVTFLVSPSKAEAAVISSLKEIQKLLVPLLIAIFVGVTVKNLLTKDVISRVFGGGKGILAAGTIGSILPPCPFISYPAIKGLKDGGVGLPATLVMLITATTVEVGQLFVGIAVFGPAIVGARILFSFIAAMIVGSLFLLIHSHFSNQKTILGKSIPLKKPPVQTSTQPEN